MRNLFVLLATLGLYSAAYAAPYEECFLENTKGITDQTRIDEVKNICREKYTPKKCRKYLPHNQPAGTSELERGMNEDSLKGCLASCDAASFVTRNFGNECSTD